MSPLNSGSFAELLKRSRAAAGLTQEELAESAGLSARGISDLERGLKHRPHAYTVQRLATALGLEAEKRTAFEAAAQQLGGSPVSAARGAPKPGGGTGVGGTGGVHAFLLADIRGYTAFTRERGDEDAVNLLTAFVALTRETVTARGGQVIEVRGDEALVVFASPRQAGHAALELQTRYARARDAASALPLQVGIGLDVGEAVPLEGGYRGAALKLAARLCSLAGPGEILASEGFMHVAGKTTGWGYLDRGQVEFQGLDVPVRVLQIAAAGATVPAHLPVYPNLILLPTSLPDEPTPFIGREREIKALTDVLQRPSTRLVTLTGPGGTGKTRLALRMAATLLNVFNDGLVFVSLAPIRYAALVPSTIARTLGIQERGGQSVVETIKEHVGRKHLLLVLDNFEHVLDASWLLPELLSACPALHVLVTSRAILHLSREHVFAVPPMTVPDLSQPLHPSVLSQSEAVSLFIERGRATDFTFALTVENAAAVAGICARLDGLPLAIELAAARVRLFPPQALLSRLEHPLTVLKGGPQDAPARQQTLRDTIQWSYKLLSQEERALFARLAVFVGGCTFEAAEAVCNLEGDLDLLDSLTSLVDKSLLLRKGETEPRLSMLETIREYALERLEDSGEGDAVRERHASYYLALVQTAESLQWTGPEHLRWLDRMTDELDNLREAVVWARTSGTLETGMRLAVGLWSFWFVRGYVAEGRKWLDDLLRQLETTERAVPPELRGHALHLAALLAWEQWDLDRAEKLLEKARSWFGEVGNAGGAALMTLQLGEVAHQQGDNSRSENLAQTSLATGRQLGNREWTARSLLHLWRLALKRGDRERAHVLYDECLALARTIEDQAEAAEVLLNLGSLSLEDQELLHAASLVEESLRLFRSLGSRSGQAASLLHLAWIARSQGEYGRALDFCHESLSLYRELGGNSQEHVRSLYQAGILAHEQGQYALATAHFDEGLALCRSAENPDAVGFGLLGLSDVARAWGDEERIVLLCQEALDLLRQAGDRYGAAFALHNLGLAAAMRGEYGTAEALFQEALEASEESLYAYGNCEILASRGRVAAASGDLPGAEKWLRESLPGSQATGRLVMVRGLEGLAAVATARGHWKRATRLYAVTQCQRIAMGTPVWPVDRALHERDLAALRHALGDEGFQATWTAGGAMTAEQALIYVLEESAIS